MFEAIQREVSYGGTSHMDAFENLRKPFGLCPFIEED
jgi:hypothetical protein